MYQPISFKILHGKKGGKIWIKVRFIQDVDYLFLDPFVVGNRISPVGNKQGLQIFLESPVQGVKGVKKQAATD